MNYSMYVTPGNAADVVSPVTLEAVDHKEPDMRSCEREVKMNECMSRRLKQEKKIPN